MIIALIAVALLLGLLLGVTTGIADRHLRRARTQDHRQRQPRIDARAEPADGVRCALCSVTTSTTSQFGLSTKRTLILPGDVRYELDLSKLEADDVTGMLRRRR